ncbi:MAG TPA: glycan-binding surface protein [Dinghuibacter sp.]|uniref:glycan-binding surface protein n=1 Tax=Dinghuibacter sp. TaxID=2024697 RepID=UPI002C83EF21|nr:glycan-binding surface protein [Dinghuibacter sp.]HTJ11760.1 glycan-binding surface protein [Dinghuibacter sp.]
MRIQRYILLGLLCGISCKKNDTVTYGPPSITRVAQPLDAASIDTASFTQWVIIYGNNLGSAQSVSFNDQSVSPQGFYASDTSVTVQVPRSIPQHVTNTVTVTTKTGTATFSFTVLIPDLQLAGMFNEYTPIGDTLTLTGQNFDLYDLDTTSTTVTFTGGVSANVISGTATALNVIVPAGAQPGPVELKGAILNIDLTSTAWYMDNRNFLFDMKNFNGWNGTSYLSSGPVPAPINGPYFHVAKSWQGGWAWDPFCSNNCAMPAALVADPTQYVNYALKFELYTPNTLPALPLDLYMCFNSGNFKEYFYDPSGTGTFPFTTHGKWETFTVPLAGWGNLAGFTFSNPIIMEFMLKDANPSQSDFSICNFRMVPIK